MTVIDAVASIDQQTELALRRGGGYLWRLAVRRPSMTSASLPAERTRWGVVLLGFAAGVVGMFQTAKMSVVLPAVREDIGLSLVGASWSTTAVSLTGALFGVIAGRVSAEFGVVRTLVAALALSAVAAAATAVLADPLAFLASRVLEGLGYLLVCAAAPAMMAAAASGRDRGVALAIWGAFVPVSVSIMSLVGPLIDAAAGWRALFLANAAVLALAALVVRTATSDPEPLGEGPAARLMAILRAAPAVHLGLYRSRASLGLGIGFMAFAALQVGYIALLPTYLITGLGLSGQTAGTILSVTTPFAIAGTVLAGMLQRFGAPDVPTTGLSFAAMGLTSAAVFMVGADVASLILLGAAFFTAGGVVGSVMFASLPARARDAAGVALLSGLLVQFGNVGSLTGAPILAGVAEGWGWGGVPWALVAMALTGIGGVVLGRR
jgi:MFS family permease